MTETFRAVEPLEHGDVDAYAKPLFVSVNCNCGYIEMSVAEARALRDWLDLALPSVKEPCKHVHVLPPSRWDPKSMCMDCGATLP